MLLEVHAQQIASLAHAICGQSRKYTNAPYIDHPRAVANLVRSVPHTPEMLAASWVHDTVEDTFITVADIRRMLGPDVATLVEELTDVSSPTDGNRAARKAIDRAHAAAASPPAKTIRLADMIDNVETIAVRDPVFAKTYIPEKAALLEVLREGDPTLYARASDLIALHYRR